MDLFSLLIGIISFVVMLYIARQTIIMLDSQKEEIERTKDIASSIRTDKYIRQRSKKLLSLKDEETVELKNIISLPVKYVGKPLPFIDQGDFYATHILTSVLGFENVEIKEVEKDKVSDLKGDAGNIMYLCSPQNNPSLCKIMPYGIINNNKKVLSLSAGHYWRSCNTIKEIRLWLKEVGLPCWFISDYDANMYGNDDPIKKIQVFDLDDYKKSKTKRLPDPLTSRVEDYYQNAKGKNYKIEMPSIVEDYGILARLTHDKVKHVIIAGIHQYGTWIVSEFLNKVFRGEIDDDPFLDIYEANNDFIAIISGEFDGDNLKVRSCHIDHHNCWKKNEDNYWKRYK